MADIYRVDLVDVDLNGGSIHRSYRETRLGAGDALANRFGVRLFRDGDIVSATGVTCQGTFYDSQGRSISLTGETNGNAAWVSLTQDCYTYPGRFVLAIRILSGGVSSTVRIVDGIIDNAII